ncbi:restriction endonuclease subunit M [Phormidesmis priestleyi ULC007]|uniref:site-specific DNA-methyltransferase (adenine-specific) n=1 Tax=Phormidesmis priestleyi ULC007 TaxID=1920490 RepID=A0A2T1DE02_9CYAN|nr:TaqI-like C-terminal specificity domain-containing protein [Phormidesmis priestleyi]PSB18683.1 restriction endonuclease subunit M [Phormidesmis priestleyi ULC007]PZO51556.1 MAG: restriction endonuclease subunit M [Phormidesmis priestleyi]
MSDAKRAIALRLQKFATGNLADNARSLFETLGYRVDKSTRLETPTAQSFLNSFAEGRSFNRETALLKDWRFVDLLFQLTKDEITGSNQLRISFGDSSRVDNTIIESYLFFAIALKSNTYTRTQLAGITREINKLFPMPVMLVFLYGQTLTLSMINRRLHKRDQSKDVLEKVTLIKDIALASPHRAHLEILFDLSLEQLYKAHKFTNFVELHQAWQKTLDSSELNKRFFREVSNWYFWATQHVVFPAGTETDEEVRNATSVIRMITRVIFVWFLKEKSLGDQPLVPEELFQRSRLAQLIHFDDPNSSTYYQAILQNLFFATLNQEMNTLDKPENRKFRHTGKTRDQHYMVHNVYRYESLFKQLEEALKLFEQVPFLNGGLFECLDHADPDQPRQTIRVDGFSDRADNPLSVPNYLFFSEEQDVDLNKIYGTKNKRFKVRGLIDIFNSYKFTITENTPIEEEIALDPELLGKVFENLLAAYNSETRVTARKQTGSFYTPREVVDYMVDESLLVYLQNAFIPNPSSKLGEGSQIQSPSPALGEGFRVRTEQRLRQLLDYKSDRQPFEPQEVVILIQAIDQLKSLDPAVGSGAFPMGLLQKLVFILGKLDPNNEQWKHQQKEREILPLLEDIRQAQQISYEAARDAAVGQLQERLQQIEADFGDNEMDYPRKLFLIENCIYGVDIQPIAVQIAKLRFFISLIVEQRVDESKLNRGILPLPNLETKFIAANTLMSIDRPQQLLLRDPQVEAKENELKRVRHEIFKARSQRTKQKYRERDRELRAEISELLKTEGWSDQTARQIAQWNPYDQNASATFFDPEWMYGVKDGFDVVIGNPPYGSEITVKQKEYFKKHYLYQDYPLDTYRLFLEKATFLAKSYGCITLIIPNTLLSNLKTKKIRKWLFSEKQINQIVHLLTSVFAAVVDTEVLIISNYCQSEENRIGIVIFDEFIFQEAYYIEQKIWKQKNGDSINIFGNSEVSAVADKLKHHKTLDQFCKITQGTKPFQVGKGKPPQTRAIVDAKPYVSEHKKDKTSRPLLRGSLIQKFQILWNENYWISFGEWLAEPRYSASHDALEKIIVRQTGDSLVATLDNRQFIVRDNLYTIVPQKNSTDLRFILGLINSALLKWFYQKVINPEKGEALAQVKRGHLAKLPIAHSDTPQFIGIFVDYILYCYQMNSDFVNKSHVIPVQDKLMLEYFEQIINGLVYELYLPEDLYAHGFTFADPLQAENLPTLNDIKGDKLEALRAIFQRLYAQDHPIRQNLIALDTLPVIRTIEGKP